MEEVIVISPEGIKGTISKSMLLSAQKAGYALPENTQGEKGDSWPQLLGKSALKGLTSIGDVPRLVGEAVENITNAGSKMYGAPVGMYGMGLKGVSNAKPNIRIDDSKPSTNYASNIPTTDDARKYLKQKTNIDLTPRADTPLKRIAATGAETAGSILPFIASGGAGAINSLASAASIGTASGSLQEMGINPLAADIGSAVITPKLNPKNLLNNFNKTKIKAAGLGPKNLDLDAAIAAQNLGVDLPTAALTDSNLTALADQWIGKTPFFGHKLKNKYNRSQDQIAAALDDIYQNIGPKKTPELEKHISDLYIQRAESLPKQASIAPTHTAKVLDKIHTDSALLSPDEQNLMQSVNTLKDKYNPKITTQYGDINIPIQKVPVKELADTKRSMNSIIKWDKDEGVKNQRRSIQKSLSDDIAEYGKANPEWYKSFREADDLYGKAAAREKVEELLGMQGTNYASGNLSYNALAKSINNPKSAEILKKNVDAKTFKKIEDLGKVTRAMVRKGLNVPNPSGTAVTSATVGLTISLFTNPVTTLQYGSALLGPAVATNLLTDKKLIDLATKIAKNPNNMISATAFNKRIKDLTGYSALALNREMLRIREEE